MDLLDLDRLLTGYINMWSGQSFWLDAVARAHVTLYVLRLGVPLVLLWMAWARSGLLGGRGQEQLLRFAAGVMLALVAARLLNGLAWVRPRPLFDPSWELQTFLGGNSQALRDWNSFPSDHAALAFAIATFVAATGSRVLGGLAFAWAILGTSLPRVYLGMHYLGDVIGGALIGVAAAAVGRWLMRVPPPLLRWGEKAEHRWPGVTVAAAYLFCAMCFTMFNDARLVITRLEEAVAGPSD